MNGIEIKHNDEWLVPTAEHVRMVAESDWPLSQFGLTLLRLLLAGFSLLFIAGCASNKPTAWQLALRKADDTLLATANATHTAVQDNSAALIEIKSKLLSLDSIENKLDALTVNNTQTGKEDGPTEGERTDSTTQVNSTPATVTEVESVSLVELYVCSTSSCAPCRRLWRDVDEGKLDGFKVIKSEVNFPIKQYPAIRYRDQNCEGGWGLIYGYGEDTRLWLRSHLLGEKSSAITSAPRVYSHSDLVAIHNQLHGGGSWTWPGDLLTHLTQTHGFQPKGSAPPVGAIFQNRAINPVSSARTVVRSVFQWPMLNRRTYNLSR